MYSTKTRRELEDTRQGASALRSTTGIICSTAVPLKLACPLKKTQVPRGVRSELTPVFFTSDRASGRAKHKRLKKGR